MRLTERLHPRRWLHRLRKDREGFAFTEFALVLPLLIVTYMGGMELVFLAMTHQQVSRHATSVADLAARFRVGITEEDVKSLLLGAELSSELTDLENRGRVILTAVTVNERFDPTTGDTTGHWIRWQRCFGQLEDASGDLIQGEFYPGEGRDDDSIPLVDGLQVRDPNTVLYAEVYYRYEPKLIDLNNKLLKDVVPIFQPRQLHYRSAFIARDGELNEISNEMTTAMTPEESPYCDDPRVPNPRT